MPGVILYGPPAAGKDTITAALHALDSRYTLFPRIKVGGGKQTGYRMVGESALDEMRARGDVLWENHRYGAVYVVDRPGLDDHLATQVPVVHLGQVEAIDAIITATPDTRWLVVSLWCPRDVATQRISARGDTDPAARLRAWDETQPLPSADLTIDTAAVLAEPAAREIHRLARLLGS
jgi:guanylate kinase